MICIVDYDAGNLRSVQKAVEHMGGETIVSSDASDIQRAEKIIFPGVGAFGKAVESIDNLGLREPLVTAIRSNKPFLGICLGMQLLFCESAENPGINGLGVFEGCVKRFPHDFKVPHLGWNVLHQFKDRKIWNNVPTDSYFLFRAFILYRSGRSIHNYRQKRLQYGISGGRTKE